MQGFYERLDKLFAKGERNEIESFLLLSLRSAENEQDNEKTVGIANELAGFYRGTARYDQSAQFFSLCLRTMSALGLEESLQYATAEMNYAGTLRLSGNYSEAMKAFGHSRALYESAGDTGSYAYVSLLNNLSLLYRDIGKLDDAATCSKHALEIVSSKAGTEEETAISLSNLASLYFQMGKYDESESKIRKALIKFGGLKEKSVHEAAAWGTLGAILKQHGKLIEAAAAYKRAADDTKAVFGENADYSIALHSRALILSALGNTDEALTEMRYSLDITEKIFGSEHPRAKSYNRDYHLLLTQKNEGSRRLINEWPEIIKNILRIVRQANA